MKKAFKRSLAIIMAMSLMVGLIVHNSDNISDVYAEETEQGETFVKTIAGIGTSVICNPIAPVDENSAWVGSYVYFGTYNGNQVKYRVLDSNTTVFGGTTMLLDCDSVLWAGSDPSSAFDADSKVWADSDIRAYLNGTFLTNNFSTAEQNAIAESTVASHALTTDSEEGVNVATWPKNAFRNYVALGNDKVFLLDVEDVSNGAYGYSQTDMGVTNRIKKDAVGNAAYWWLRSAISNYSNYAGYVYSVGSINYDDVSYISVGVSPALNVNLSSVLFSSVISGTAGATGAEYKLTLLDNNMSIISNGAVTRNGDTITIPHTIEGTNSTNVTQTSVILLDKEYLSGNSNDAEVLYYGALNNEGSFIIPSDLSSKVCGKDYYAYIVAEDVNGEKETDYASEPARISIPSIAKGINLGTRGIDNPVILDSNDSPWTGSYVYFGMRDINGDGDTEPVKYRVLDIASTDFSADGTTQTILLDCDTTLWMNDKGITEFQTNNGNWSWAASDIKEYLNGTFYSESFNVWEQKIITESNKDEPSVLDGDGKANLDFVPLEGEKIFVLDAKEITRTTYGYYSDSFGATNRIKTGYDGSWWTRSPYSGKQGGYVTNAGSINWGLNYGLHGVSPALNINPSYILLITSVEESKTSVLSNSSDQIYDAVSSEWKITLSDTRKNVQIIDDKKVIKSSDGTIIVPYKYTDTATTDAERVNQISVMITDKAYTESDAEILYYGALHNFSENASEGNGTFGLPSALSGQDLGTDYHLYILAEHVNTTNATDYASAPVEITEMDYEVDNLSIPLDAPVPGVTLDTDAGELSNISNTVISWKCGGVTVTGNAEYNSEYTVDVKLTPDTGYIFLENTCIRVNGEIAGMTLNDDGTATVTYTFPVTDMGTITHTSVGYEGTYDGTEHGIIVTVTDPSDTTITYSTDAGLDKTYTPNNPQFVNAGEYTVYYKIEKTNYTPVTGSKTIKINKKSVAITPADQSVIYGDNIDETAYTVVGLLSGDNINSVTITPSTTLVTDNGEISVSYDNVINSSSVDVTDNYDITCNKGILVIANATITSSAMGYEGEYDGNAHGIIVEVTNPINATITYSENGIDYDSNNPTYSDAGEYTVYYKIEKANYDTVTGSKTVKITKKALSVIAADQTITEGTEIDSSKYTITGLIDGEQVNLVTLTPSTSSVTDNGTIAVTIDKILKADNDVTNNYNISYTTGRLTIVEKPTVPDDTISPGDTTDSETQKDEPQIMGDDGATGWDAISDKINDSVDDASDKIEITVDMNGTTIVPGHIIDEIKDKNITISFELDNGLVWIIDGEDIKSDNINDINLDVVIESKDKPFDVIPSDVIDKVAEGAETIQIQIPGSDEFGFEAELVVKFDDENAGKYANLYHYNPKTKKLEYINVEIIADNGEAGFGFNQAANYVIIINNTGVSPNVGYSNNYIVVLVMLCVVFGIVGVITYRRIDKKVS